MEHVALSELRDFGHLQEVNRLYFHPRGMALAIAFDIDDGVHPAVLGRLVVLDYRREPLGFVFDWPTRDPDDLADSVAKAARVAEDMAAREPARRAALGFCIEPMPEVPT